MKWLFLFLCCSVTTLYAQNAWYFISVDSVYVGVKQQNRMIVPLGLHRMTYDIDFKKPITSSVFELPGTLPSARKVPQSVALPINTVYNLEGIPLYYTLLFDNGSDYFQEGVQRIVSITTGKVGFATLDGNIVVTPQWDFATPFNYGYAQVMNDVKKEPIDDEHWRVVAQSDTSFLGYVNQKGELVEPYMQQKHPKDYKLSDTAYLPYPFMPSETETLIMKDFQKYYDVLNSISLFNLSTTASKEQASLQFEVIQTPSTHFPYYTLQAYQFQRIEDSFTFLYDPKNASFFHFDFPFTNVPENIVPINNFIHDRLGAICQRSTSTSSHRKFSFDACAMYREWQLK